MSDFESEMVVYHAIQHEMHQTHGNMNLDENTDSENDTEVFESLFTPSQTSRLRHQTMPQQNMTMKILIDYLQRLWLTEKMV